MVQRNEDGSMINPETFPDTRGMTNQEAKERLDQLLTELATVRTKQDELVTNQIRLEQKTDSISTRVDTIDGNTRRTPPP